MTASAGPQIFEDTSRNPSRPSVLRSIISAKGHKRSPSAGDALVSRRMDTIDLATLPTDHPHAHPQQLPLRERAHNREAAGAPAAQFKPLEKRSLHKKTKSTLSLKGLMGDRDKKDIKSSGSSPECPSDKGVKHPRSYTNLSALLKRSQRGKKAELEVHTREKENRTPTEDGPGPIWASFATQPLQDSSGAVHLPQQARTLEEEVSLYTPQHYSPSKQRNFHDYHRPTLAKHAEQKPRPKSDYISSGTLKVKEALAHVQRTSFEKKRSPSGRTSVDSESVTIEEPSNVGSRGKFTASAKSHVKAVVAAFNAKDAESTRSVDPKELDNEFEKMLVRLLCGNYRSTEFNYCLGLEKYSSKYA
jgi:hypothetical protein